jgi:hypothetical protein
VCGKQDAHHTQLHFSILSLASNENHSFKNPEKESKRMLIDNVEVQNTMTA